MVYMYHSFLIHSSADGHLGCFHVNADFLKSTEKKDLGSLRGRGRKERGMEGREERREEDC